MSVRPRTLTAVPVGLVLVASLLAGCNNTSDASSTPSDAMMDETHDGTTTEGTDG